MDLLDANLATSIRKVPALIAQLYKTVRALNVLFPNRPFTPDGHLVGSIGDVVAADTYDLNLEKCSNSGFNATTKTRQTVEIKLTGGASVSLSSEGNPPEFLIVLHLHSETGFSEIYNGEFPVDLWRKKTASKRKVVSLRLSELKKLKPRQALHPRHPLEELNRLFIRDGT